MVKQVVPTMPFDKLANCLQGNIPTNIYKEIERVRRPIVSH